MKAQYEHVAYVRSFTDSRKRYEIKRNADGQLSCGCPSWRFAHAPKTCKHIAGMEAATYTPNYSTWNGAGARPKPTERAEFSIGAETFEVIRAIKFRRSVGAS